jgi:hypothetical protein
VRDATGEADRPPPSSGAMEVLDVSGDERSSDIGMQHEPPSEVKIACHGF